MGPGRMTDPRGRPKCKKTTEKHIVGDLGFRDLDLWRPFGATVALPKRSRRGAAAGSFNLELSVAPQSPGRSVRADSGPQAAFNTERPRRGRCRVGTARTCRRLESLQEAIRNQREADSQRAVAVLRSLLRGVRHRGGREPRSRAAAL
eukprot:5199243-Pyramimonas_sp.AAC.1